MAETAVGRRAEVGGEAVGVAGEVEGAGAPRREEESSPLPMGGGPGGEGLAVGHPDRQISETDGNLASLRWAFLVGEALHGEDVERLQTLAPRALAVNLYGATETQRAVGWYAVTGRVGSAEIMPLGRGMPDVQLLVLTPTDDLAGIGELAFGNARHEAIRQIDVETRAEADKAEALADLQPVAGLRPALDATRDEAGAPLKPMSGVGPSSATRVRTASVM